MTAMSEERRRAHERAEIREAITMSYARESIDRLLGEELIAAAREAVKWWSTPGDEAARRFDDAIDRLKELVGKP